MQQRNALIVMNFYDANQTLRNHFAELIQLEQWIRYPGVPNAYCTIYVSDAPDAALVEQAESDMASAALAAGIEEWDAYCVLEDSVVNRTGKRLVRR